MAVSPVPGSARKNAARGIAPVRGRQAPPPLPRPDVRPAARSTGRLRRRINPLNTRVLTGISPPVARAAGARKLGTDAKSRPATLAAQPVGATAAQQFSVRPHCFFGARGPASIRRPDRSRSAPLPQ
ncbi:hypothetical protein [Burkholderia arboris]|uniref:hypothetical protein n=1 Tax=Burkholderia arboris TaxID=488730 RepID=UPI0012D9A101|nr:hypothetical protein [Burkholderia arboris]MCA8488935.1 hypothetical protein [Burkholderia arboris]